jgi:isochorismate hydrolase
MNQAERTFPTLRRWRGMSESEQDALLDKIERRRRRHIIFRGIVAALCVLTLAIGAALVVGH